MKRNKLKRFFQQKQYAIASLVLFVAIAAMAGVYFSEKTTKERQEAEMAQKEKELSDTVEQQGKSDYIVLENDGTDSGDANETNQTNEADAAKASSVIRPNTETDTQTDDTAQDSENSQGNESTQDDSQAQTGENSESLTGANSTLSDTDTQADGEEDGQQEKTGQTTGQTEEKQETATQAKAAQTNKTLHFSPESDLSWPLQGDVIMNYSMDQTVYFATLDQYKYNPALVIAAKVNDPVIAAATGVITDISTNEETGVTVTMDLGDGYSAVYGQLKEVLYKEGTTVEAQDAIGYIAEPTKYYSVEGSNLYFELLKDDEPINPMQYME